MSIAFIFSISYFNYIILQKEITFLYETFCSISVSHMYQVNYAGREWLFSGRFKVSNVRTLLIEKIVFEKKTLHRHNCFQSDLFSKKIFQSMKCTHFNGMNPLRRKSHRRKSMVCFYTFVWEFRRSACLAIFLFGDEVHNQIL